MTQLSSKRTFLYKKVFPALWFGSIAAKTRRYLDASTTWPLLAGCARLVSTLETHSAACRCGRQDPSSVREERRGPVISELPGRDQPPKFGCAHEPRIP